MMIEVNIDNENETNTQYIAKEDEQFNEERSILISEISNL